MTSRSFGKSKKKRPYLCVDFFEVRVILVDLEVDLGGRDGHRAVNGNARGNQNRRCADVDRALKVLKVYLKI